jgi:hypothetical protein
LQSVHSHRGKKMLLIYIVMHDIQTAMLFRAC